MKEEPLKSFMKPARQKKTTFKGINSKEYLIEPKIRFKSEIHRNQMKNISN